MRLENNDLILVRSYTKTELRLKELLKNQEYLRLKTDESLLDLINYSGGFQERAFTKSIKLTRVVEDELMIIDVEIKINLMILKLKLVMFFKLMKLLNKFS